MQQPAYLASSESSEPRMRRDGVTWTGYLSLAVFTFFLNIQGNILPFLRDAFGLSYRAGALHPAALAFGLALCGLVAERLIAALGRRRAIAAGLLGLSAGALMIVAAPAPAVSVAGCFVMGGLGGLILAAVAAMLVGLGGLGLGVALLYPLTLAFAIEVAGPLGDTASARASLASGLAVLIFPILVATIADGVGLWLALMVLQMVGVLSFLSSVTGQALPRRAGRAAG